MYLKRMKTIEGELAERAMALYQSAFPAIERRDAAEHLRVMKKEDYHFDLIMQNEQFCGVMLYWETADFIFLEHFATLPELRGQGIGSAALSLLKAKGKPVILEIEPPADELTRRRLGFYQRNGFKVTPHRHIQAKYRPDDADLVLTVLSYPHGINEEEYRRFYRYMQREVSCAASADERST